MMIIKKKLEQKTQKKNVNVIFNCLAVQQQQETFDKIN